VVGYVMSVEGS